MVVLRKSQKMAIPRKEKLVINTAKKVDTGIEEVKILCRTIHIKVEELNKTVGELNKKVGELDKNKEISNQRVLELLEKK